jgi:tetratricopeptide (TPR) repeat protein
LAIIFAARGIDMKRLTFIGLVVLVMASQALIFSGRINAGEVTVTERDVVIPTYLAGDPEPSPMFYFGRASQGAEGRVYPYPLYDSLTHEKADKTYRIVYLENEYVRIGILPEIGGRLIEAVDKSNNYDFIYHQRVIKPALIGLIGAWMSGGIEWNIPHHHRATTFLPVQSKIEEDADGSKTVWVGELELRDRMRWAVGYTLHPGKSYLQCSVRIVNRTPVANTMLCFANVAVHANDQYQVIFPPSTQYVTFHGKREFTTWPIATTRFNGVDFSRGVDVSWYKNHPNAMSMFAWNYSDDFFAGYDHGKEAGIISVADHHVVPGKKFWTWGNGPRGQMWDKILTDDDGPYIELMAGAYSDNQPDYSWLQPYETKSFEMHWYPFRDLGGVKQANLDAAVNLEIADGNAKVGFGTTSAYPSAHAVLKAGEKVLFDEKIEIDPRKPFVKQGIEIPAGTDEHDLRASLTVDGRELVAYSPLKLPATPVPTPVVPPAAPKDIKTVEELYLAGQRIEQFHAPGQEPEPYWEEALKRDPGDSRVNTALGIRKLKEAKFAEAEQHFRTAIKRLSTNYTSPKDGEPFYYLGVALESQGKHDEAYDLFLKASWSEAWRGPAYFAAAQIDAQRNHFAAALDHIDRSLLANGLGLQVLNLKSAVLRHLGRTTEALAVVNEAAGRVDPLDVGLRTERWLLSGKSTDGELMATLCEHPATGLEAAAEYSNAGLWEDGASVLKLLAASAKDKNRVSPLAYYYLADFAKAEGKGEQAAEYRKLARQMSPEYCFPFQAESIAVLRRAMEADPNDARAPYYLGNLLFDWQPEEAVKLWKQSAALDPSLAMVHRNLAAAYAHQKPTPDNKQAISELEQAVAGPSKYAMHFAELDELYAGNGASPEKRLALLEANQSIVQKRDDALSREIGMKIFAGKFDDAIGLMTGRTFSVWEGGSLDVAEHWVNARILRGRKRLAAKQFSEALADFQAAKSIPDNLPNDRGGGTHQSEIAYWIGNAYDGQADAEHARQAWREASESSGPGQGFGRRPGGFGAERLVQSYYQAAAKQKLGQASDTEKQFRQILTSSQSAADQNEESIASRPARRADQSPHAAQAMAKYVAGLAHLGLGETDAAKTDFEKALQLAPDHLGAKFELTQIAGK